MFKLLVCRKPANEKSSAPVVPAQFSLPGCARESTIKSAKAASLSEVGTDTVISVLDTRAIGKRSATLYGKLS